VAEAVADIDHATGAFGRCRPGTERSRRGYQPLPCA
jgi:hypothetical protein